VLLVHQRPEEAQVRVLSGRPDRDLPDHLGSGRIVASAIEAPNILENLV
jgi:hypothetical protein